MKLLDVLCIKKIQFKLRPEVLQKSKLPSILNKNHLFYYNCRNENHWFCNCQTLVSDQPYNRASSWVPQQCPSKVHHILPLADLSPDDLAMSGHGQTMGGVHVYACFIYLDHMASGKCHEVCLIMIWQNMIIVTYW